MNKKPKYQPTRRVLIIVENLSVPFDRRVWSEATTLRQAGYEVSIICPKAQGFNAAEETIDGIHIFRHSLPLDAHGPLGYFVEYSGALISEFILSLKIARRYGFDVIHACNPPDLIFLIGAFYKFLARKSFLFDHHDVCPQLYEAKFRRRGFFWWLLVIAEYLTFKLSDISIATNQSYRKIAIKNGRMPAEKVFVVRSGPNLDRIKPVSPDARWLNGRKFLVAYVGVISKSEGLDLLLQAVDHIVYKLGRTDIQFVVVGSGPEWHTITRLCAKLQLGDYITFTGRVDDTILLKVLSTADVCVNPDRVSSMTNISTMNKIMEYMAIGKPIVQFDVTEGRFSAEEASLYAKKNDPIDFADKILELIGDPKKRARMGKFGQRRVTDELAWSHEQPKLLAAYDALFSLRDQRKAWFSRLATRNPKEVSIKKNNN